MNEQDELERPRAENERWRDRISGCARFSTQFSSAICATGRTLPSNDKGEGAPFGGDLKNPRGS